MMRWIVGTSLKARRAVVAIAVVIMVFGVWTLRRAETDVLPEFAPVTVDVQTEALGLSAEEVEQLITVPLEQDLLDGVAWLDHIESKSVPGLSSVHMIFEKGTDLYRARQVVQERISQAAGLPQVSRPPQMLQPQSSTARTSIISLSSKQLTPLQIGVLARWTIRPRLLAVPGVSNVAIWGQRERQLQVQVDPAKLRDKKVTLEQVIGSTGNALWVSPLTFLEASTPGTGGFIDTPTQRIGIQHNLPIIKPEDLSQITIDDSNGLTLGDVATVVEDHQPLIGDAVLTGNEASPDSFLVVVDKLPYANTAEVQKGVNEALDDLRPGLSGLDMDATIFRPTAYSDKAESNLVRSAIVGGILLVVALFLLLFSWRAALTALVSVAFAFIVAGLVIDAFGTSFNAVIIAGLAIALALVIDDAVSNVDRTATRLREQADPAEGGPTVAGTYLHATLETARSAIWASVIFALALVPLFLINGLSGDSFYPPMAGAALLAVVASLLTATHRGTGPRAPAVPPAAAAAGVAGDPRHQERLRRGVRAGGAHADPGVRGDGRARDRRGLRGPDLQEVAAAHAPRHQPPGEVGRPARHLAARDGPHHVAGRHRAPCPPRGEGRRCAGGPGDTRRRTGRLRLGRDVGQHRPVGRLREDGQGGQGRGRRLPGLPPRGDDLHEEPDDRRARSDAGPDHGPGLRQRQPRHAARRRRRTSRRPSPARTAW